jgi:hypothetical protein
MNAAIKHLSDGLNLVPEEVLKIVYDEIEESISAFRHEIRIATSVETLEFIRRTLWDKLFSEAGCYYELCKRSPMLKILRLNADIRYCDLLKKKKQSEREECCFRFHIIKRTVVSVVPLPVKAPCHESAEEVDGELTENEIIY